jgi:hypothetical protein
MKAPMSKSRFCSYCIYAIDSFSFVDFSVMLALIQSAPYVVSASHNNRGCRAAIGKMPQIFADPLLQTGEPLESQQGAGGTTDDHS